MTSCLRSPTISRWQYRYDKIKLNACYPKHIIVFLNWLLIKVVGQFGTGQFGTRTIWHQYNKTDNPKRSGNKYDDDRASFILVWKVWSAAGKLQLHALPGNLQLQLEMLYKNSELGTWGQIKNLGSLTTLRIDMLFFFNNFLQRYAVKKSEHFQTHYPTIAINFIVSL